ncbi:MAG: PAS domain S-box protein [Bacteroidales bacterium]
MSELLRNNIPPEFLNPSDIFNEAMNAVDIHWWYWDVLNQQLIISPKLSEILGYHGSDFTVPVTALNKQIHTDDREEHTKVFDKFIFGEIEIYEFEYRLKVNDQWAWYYNRGTVFSRDKQGNPILTGGIAMDISHRYGHMLSKAEDWGKFEFIFRNSNESILIVSMGKDREPGKIIEVNDAAAKLYGTKPEALIGLDPYVLVEKSIVDSRYQMKKDLYDKGNMKVEVNTNDYHGNKIYLEVHAHLFRGTGKDLFIAIVTDKTESQQYKKELKASELALKQSEKIYRSLIQAADDRIGLFDTDGNAVILNNAYTEMLGYTLEEYRVLEDKDRIHPEDIDRMKSLVPELVKSGYMAIEYRARHRDGHYMHMNSKSVLVKNPDLDKDYVLFIIRDVSDKVAFEKELIAAKEKAVESDKLKSAFLANMSHEIRTPMNSIVGFANLLTEKDIDATSQAEYVKRINRNSEQLLALMSDIIDLAKIESNQLSVSYTKLILENLFNELLTYGRLQLEQRGRKNVVIKYLPDPVKRTEAMEGDLVRLTQILQNLINNAVKFTIQGEITIGYMNMNDKSIRFFVKDTGIGIDQKNIEIIFDQFRQVDGSNVRKYGGTGLGLAICRNLTGLLNGKIWVESEKDSGSTFYLELPLKSGFELNENRDAASREFAVSSKIKVLMVDDDQDSLMLMTTILRYEGIQTVTADSGYKALKILEREELPDIVLMDLQMPVMSGIQTLHIIREQYPALKVVAQSAHALEGERRKSLGLGFNDYISKPYSKQGLLEVIKRVVEG